MPKKLTKDQQEVWDRLNYVPPVNTNGRWAYSASGTAPNAPPGSIYFDTTNNHMMLFDGTRWKRAS